jgi:hypothetical protein
VLHPIFTVCLLLPFHVSTLADEYTVKQLPKLPGNAFRRGHSAIRWGMRSFVTLLACVLQSVIFLNLASTPTTMLGEFSTPSPRMPLLALESTLSALESTQAIKWSYMAA